ncbi:transposase domain-containing protein [Rhizophagus clarus]|uniref:Transposase domain-containing protein n=1 Tax=Rhizophagus clarus TaxID=94130 RepID=A0A8H3M320_9GLOM|nr:transposase domain-containing protein [Rhizophagus clarus]
MNITLIMKNLTEKKTDDEEELIVSESENNSLNLEGSLKDRTLLENINLTTEHNITNEVAKGLRLLEIKVRHNISNTAFKEIVTATVAKRYQVEGQSRAQVAYFSIQDRLVIQYQDSARTKQLRYHSEYISRNIDGTIGDVFDGAQYKNLLQKGYFQDDRDIVLLGSVDGYQLFKQKCDDCWIILFINANLPPEQRVKKENLLITSIIPGPKAPKDFNSFLKPVVDELCLLEGIYNNHIYYPTTPPSDANNTNETYDPSNLPRRMHSDYVTRIGQIVTIELLRTRELLASNLGVVGRSVLLDIRSTQFPACFPVDIMHLFYENVAPYMLRHWMGSFFKDSTLNNQPYTLNNKQWSEIGANMDAIKKSIPTEFGRPPRNIFRHYSGYKAEEWASWITLYSLPLLKDQLPSVYLKGWSLLLQFHNHYERYYYQPVWKLIDGAHIRNATPEFITKTFYAQVNYFLVYKYKDQEKMLANVKWTSNVNEDALGTTFFVGDDSSTQFIDVTAIDRCVGFMK